MKIQMELTVDVDPDAWAAEYGLDLDQVPSDVRRWITSAVDNQLRDLDLGEVVFR
ncbi:MAG: hypothetical protein ACRCYU_09280 [Nocardioides sp.]